MCKALDEIVVSCSLNCEWISDCYNLEAARKSVAEVRPTFQSLKSLEIVCFKWGWLLVYFLDTDVVPTDCISDCILSRKFQFLYSTFFGDCETRWIWRLALLSFISLEKPDKQHNWSFSLQLLEHYIADSLHNEGDNRMLYSIFFYQTQSRTASNCSERRGVYQD